LGIFKNGIELIHLSIHLAMKDISPKSSGIIHIYKDIYDKSALGGLKKKLYALISVSIPIGKPNSLEFSIADGLTTLFMPDYQTYDPQIQQEMDIIILVLNDLFDEKQPEFFIGKKESNSNINKLETVHNNTNRILKSINMHNRYYTRKNKGVLLFPYVNTNKMVRSSTYNRRRSSKRPYLFSNRANNRQHKSRKIIFASAMSNSLNHNGVIEEV
jgi:hypothetical protein